MSDVAEDLRQLMADVVNVRRWTDEAVPEVSIERLLDAFGLGPSVAQPWEVFRLDSRDARQAAVRETLEPLMTPGSEGAQRWLLESSLVLAICLETRRATARIGEFGKVAALQEVGGAVQNLRLMANAQGLRTAVVREFHPDRLAAALGLPWFLEPVALIAIGSSDAVREYPPRYSVREFFHPYESLIQGSDRPGPAPPTEAAAGPHGTSESADRKGAAISAIYRRRSVRQYTGEPLQVGVLEQLLGAAIQAPSGGNMQPWEFILLEAPEVRRAAVATTYAGFYSGPGAQQQDWILQASLLVAACVNKRRTAGRYGDKLARSASRDVAAAIQNLLIAATELGLGSCWVGGFREEELAAVLMLPEEVEPVGLLAVGPAASEPMPRYRMPPEFVTHRDRWGVPFYPADQASSPVEQTV